MTTSRQSISRLFTASLALLPVAAGAETLFLTSGEVVEGTLTAVQENLFLMTQPNGEVRKIPRTDIARVEIQKEPPETEPGTEPPKNFLNALFKTQSKYATPGQTFQAWRKAAMAGDIDAMTDCYASFRKDEVRKELKAFSRQQRDQMRKTTGMTEFTAAEPLYQGDRAALEVTWRIGLQSDSQVLQFALEKSDWKLIQ